LYLDLIFLVHTYYKNPFPQPMFIELASLEVALHWPLRDPAYTGLRCMWLSLLEMVRMRTCKPSLLSIGKGIDIHIPVITDIRGFLPPNHQTHQSWDALYPCVPLQRYHQHTYSLSTANRLQPTKRLAWKPVFRPFAKSRLTPKHLSVDNG
jgi:hypothetical protein